MYRWWFLLQKVERWIATLQRSSLWWYGCKVTVFTIQCINQKHTCHKNENARPSIKTIFKGFWEKEKENKENSSSCFWILIWSFNVFSHSFHELGANYHVLRIITQGLLHRWTSQLDLGITAGGLERAVSVHNST